VSYAFLDIKQNTKEGVLSYTDKKDEVGCVFFKSPKTEFSGEQADWLKSNSYLLPDSFIKGIGGLDNLKHSLDSDPKKEFVDFLALAGNVGTSFSVQSLGPSSLDSWKCAISTDSGRKNFCRSISSITEEFQISCIGIDWEPISAITRYGLRDDFVEAMKSLSLQLKDKGIEFPVTVNHNVLNDFGKNIFIN
jgi:GH18 family chitinase